MSKKLLAAIVLIECIGLVAAFIAGLVWYPHLHQCIVFSWHLTGAGGSTGSQLICKP